MDASVDPLLPPERRLSGATLASLAFVTGTLVALLPMYYLYNSRERAAAAPPPALQTSSTDTHAQESVRDVPLRFASRMTYELSRTPVEPSAAPLRVAANAPLPAQSLEPAPRVQNARPILATPPDPRDTTRAIENEARRSEYREPPQQVAQASVGSRVVEGRELMLPPKGVPTRPIAAAASEPAARSVETTSPPNAPASRTPVATAALIGGATPVTAAPEIKVLEPQKPKTEAPPAAADALGARLAATREWLAAAPQTTHTIQLMGSSSEANLRARLQALGKLLDPAKLYVFRTVAQGKPSMTVVYGAFGDRQAALQALEKLPPAVAANRPVLRTVNGIRAEQKQHRVDDAGAKSADPDKS